MDAAEQKRAKGDIDKLLKGYRDAVAFEEKTQGMLRNIIKKSDDLDPDSQERILYACDRMDDMFDSVLDINKLIKGYLSPFGLPYDKLYDMSYNDFAKMFSKFVRIYREYREAYDDAYDQYTYVGKKGYYDSQRYIREAF